MPNKIMEDFKSGINHQDPVYDLAEDECYLMNNIRYQNRIIESIPGTQRFHDTALEDNATCIMPYYNDETDDSQILCAAGANIYKQDKQSNDFVAIKTNLTPNKISSFALRFGIMYIPSESDGLMKYQGGQVIETVGSGLTAPGSFKQIVYMREIDRMFGIRSSAILGQITWCDLDSGGSANPESWDAANVIRFKLKDGEIVEGAGILYGKLIVFCTYTTWIFYVSGNEENWRLEEAPTGVGLVALNTLRKVGNEYWFLGDSPQTGLGIYAFNGSTSRKLTTHVDPIFTSINRDKIELCAAEYHDDLYTFSFPKGSDSYPRTSIDLDTVNLRSNGVPAVYGTHDFGFKCSAVLNSRHYNNEFLIGDANDKYIYKEHGTTWKSTHDTVGSTIYNRFVSQVYSDEVNIMKLYREFAVLFKPTGYFEAIFNAYLSYGTRTEPNKFVPIGNVSSTLGEFNVFSNRIMGNPQFSEAWYPTAKRGSAVQFEILNNINATKLAVSGFRYGYTNLYTSRIAQYAQSTN